MKMQEAGIQYKEMMLKVMFTASDNNILVFFDFCHLQDSPSENIEKVFQEATQWIEDCLQVNS